MRHLTLYVDETGQFASASTQTGAAGLLLVGGLLLPGTPDELDATLGPRVSEAFAPWRGPLRAATMRDLFAFASYALRQPPAGLPAHQRSLLDQLAATPPGGRAVAFRALSDGPLSAWLHAEADGVLGRLAALLAALVPAAVDPPVVAVAEHGTAPTAAGHAAMFDDLIRLTLWALHASPSRDPVTLHVVVDEHAHLRPLPNLAALAAEPVAPRRTIRSAAPAPRVVPEAAKRPGLVLVDLLLHHLRGEGVSSAHALRPADAEALTRDAFAELLATDLGLRGAAPLVLGGPPLAHLRAYLAGERSRDATLAVLSPPHLTPSDGTVRACWETAAHLAEVLSP